MLKIGFFKEDIEIAMNKFAWDENNIVIHLVKKGTKNLNLRTINKSLK